MLSYQGTFKAATVQAEPVWLDADATISKSIDLIEQASGNGAKLIAFPEVFIPGYPYWSWIGDQKWGMSFIRPYHENSLELGDARMQRLQRAAAQNSIAVVMGYSEREGGSRFLSQVFIDESGQIVANRRKLKPTHVERTVYGEGNGTDFLTHDFSFGRVGGLNCWEHFQPLSKFMMFSLHEQVHVASWPAMFAFEPNADSTQLSVMANETVTRSYAIEGQVFVLAATQVIGKAGQAVFCDTKEKRALLPLGCGWARIFGPDGSDLATPLGEHEEGILYAEIDLSQILLAKAGADAVGHYSRPDVLSLLINTQNQTPVRHLGPNGQLATNSNSRIENYRLKERAAAAKAISARVETGTADGGQQALPARLETPAIEGPRNGVLEQV